MRAGHGLAARVRSASLAPVVIASRLGMSLAGFPSWDVDCRGSRRCAEDVGGESLCVAPACPLPDVPPGGGRSADEPASYALACPGRRGVRSPGGIRCLPSHHCSAMPSHALALASSASPAPPVPSPPCSKLRIERGRRRKRSRPGWRCAPPPPPAAATRTEGGNAP